MNLVFKYDEIILDPIKQFYCQSCPVCKEYFKAYDGIIDINKTILILGNLCPKEKLRKIRNI